MSNLTHSFRLLEITRSQPQYGYALAGIPKGELSDLAQHHYLVTIFAWLLSREINAHGGSLHIERVLEVCLTHDLGELFGGDIAMPYVRANPAAKQKATEFEKENQRFLASNIKGDPKYLQMLFDESLKQTSDEAIVAKLADYLEVTHYKLFIGRFTEGDLIMSCKSLYKYIEKIKSPSNKKAVLSIMDEWKEQMQNPSSELFEEYKKEDF